MSTYYIHDGRNEVGPFTIDVLKQQKLTRNTPIRQKDSNSWMPAERLADLKPIVVPRKIRRPKDIVPAVKEHIADLQQRKPHVLYGSLLVVALLSGISFYSMGKAEGLKLAAQNAPAAKAETVANKPEMPLGVAATENKPEEKPVIKEDATKTARLKWNKLITATNSNYGIGLLGGIKDLSVVITNRSDFPVDEAIAKLTYIKAGGGVWKTKLITIHGIAAHDSKGTSVTDVGRGKKVKVSLYKVVSKKMKFNYTEGQKIKNADDPYFKE